MIATLKKTAQKGFTLIELLVVIGILGVLAAALIATIDPFEQLKKAQDTQMKNVATEFLGATTRYYANHNELPWAPTSTATDCFGSAMTSVPISSLDTCITAMVGDGELKSSFKSAQNRDLILVTNPNPQTNNATDTIVCFKPQSKAQQEDANTRYTLSGAAATGCMSQTATGGTACYWCAQ